MNNIGLIFFDSGDYDEAIGFYLKSLDISEQIEDTAGIAYTCGNLGRLFSEIQDFTDRWLSLGADFHEIQVPFTGDLQC